MPPAAQAAAKEAAIPLLLGIDVGGTKTVLALGDETGAIRASRRRPTAPSGQPEQDVARIAEDARALLREAGVATADIAAVGVSAPGPLDPEAGAVLHPPNLPGWERVPLRDWLSAELGRPVHVENDANAAALAEWRFGAGRGARHMVYLTMSTGVGGGLVLGGRLHRGIFASAGEVGHVPIVWEGEPCACGLRGCLEAYVGGAAWTRRLARLTPAGSRVAALAGDPTRARPEHVVAAAREGDDFARAEMDRYNDFLARAIVQLAFTLAPEIVVLGTIPTAAGDALCLDPVRRRVRAHLWPFLAEELRIAAAALGERLPELAGIVVAREGSAGGG